MDHDWDIITHYLVCRSGQRCEVCGQTLTRATANRHHRLPRGMGGTSDPDQHRLDRLLLVHGDGLGGVTLCHGMVETRDPDAHGDVYDNGWIVRRGMDPATVPVLLFGASASPLVRPRWVLLDPFNPNYINLPGPAAVAA